MGMSSKFARSAAEARSRRVYQSSGVAIFRPSASVTTSSVDVNSTEHGRKSPTSISKMLMPCRQQFVSMQSHVPKDITNFMCRESGIHRYGEIIKPHLQFFVPSPHVNVRRFMTFVGIEEDAIRPES